MNKNNANDIVIKLYDPISQFDSVKEIWTSLLKKCLHSYYLSWPWTEIWIKSLPPDCNLCLVVGFKDESPVIAFFLGSKITTRHRFFKFRQLSLNQTLIPYIDATTYIEYNAILIDPAITISLESLLELIPIKSWDQFHMIRCRPTYQPDLILNYNPRKKYNLTITKHKSYYVNLDKIRRNNNDYLTLLSQNRRQQIRRSIKEYEKMGKIQIHLADNVVEALTILDELIDLHQSRWTTHGYPGALSNEYALEFHKNLISTRFRHGEIQLLKISAGNYTLGCLYNFIYNGSVLFYICGFNYLPGNLYRPGLVCHYFAIVHNAISELNCYDFLAGEDDYKSSLSTDYNEMQNVLIQKKSTKNKVEEITVKLYWLYKKLATLCR